MGSFGGSMQRPEGGDVLPASNDVWTAFQNPSAANSSFRSEFLLNCNKPQISILTINGVPKNTSYKSHLKLFSVSKFFLAIVSMSHFHIYWLARVFSILDRNLTKHTDNKLLQVTFDGSYFADRDWQIQPTIASILPRFKSTLERLIIGNCLVNIIYHLVLPSDTLWWTWVLGLRQIKWVSPKLINTRDNVLISIIAC